MLPVVQMYTLTLLTPRQPSTFALPPPNPNNPTENIILILFTTVF